MKIKRFLRDSLKLILKFSGVAWGLRILFSSLNELEHDRIRSLSNIHKSVNFHPGNIVITHPEKTIIGEGSVLNGDTYLETIGGVTIGRYVHIARNFTIFTANHNYRSLNSIPYDQQYILKPVVIKDFVWIGSNVSIVPGITVGEGAIIGMGTVVVKDVPKCAIVGGNPSEIIGYRDQELFERLKAERKFH